MFAALVLASCLQADADSFVKFGKGTSWTFDQSDGDKKSVTTMTVEKTEDGKTFINVREGDAPSDTTVAWYVEDGFWISSRLVNGTFRPEARILKMGSKKGDTWSASLEERRKMDATHQGTEEIKVAAGTYKDAAHVRIVMDGGTMDLYLVPKVGLVKLLIEAGDETKRLELKEFKEGK